MIKNSLESVRPKEERLDGIYRGVIEDNKDDKKAGRCKIRVFNVHTQKKIKDDVEGIPTEELPWSEPVMGLFEGSVSGFGSWTVPLQGSHVFLFFENGNIMEPRYFATVPGIPEDKNHGYKDNEGFSDPNKNYPKDTKLEEPDVHRLARDETEETVVDHRKENVDKGVQLALGQGNWDEPDPFYYKTEVKYPYNNVIATHSGITIEMDNSDKPRIHIYHPSNSYIEIDDEGNIVIRNSQDKYEITDRIKRTHIAESYHRSINNDRTSKVDNNEDEEIGNNRTREIGNKNDDTIGADETRDIGNNQTVTIGADKTITISGNYTVNITGDTLIESQGNTTVNGSNVYLNDGTGQIVTTNHICQVTGLPHNDGSSTCYAEK